MGKKKYGKLGYWGKSAWNKEQAEKYNINPDDFTNDAHGGSRYEDFDQDGYEKAIANAMRNDFDVRSSIRDAKASGNKKAQKLSSGISNIVDAYDADKFMRKTHTNRLDNGGKYDTGDDFAGVSNYWQKKGQENANANVASIDDINGLKADMAARRNSYQGAAKAPLQKSNELAGAEQRLAGDESSQSIYGFNNNAAPTDNAPKDAARHFLFDYKSKLGKAI